MNLQEQTLLLEIHTTKNSETRRPIWNPLDYLEEEPQKKFSGIELAEIISANIEEVIERLNIKHKITNYEDELGKLVVGMEVGDDRVDLSQSILMLILMIIYQSSIFGMETSWKDTFISKLNWNFCEVTSLLPSAIEESFDYAKRSSFDKLKFNDVPAIRTIIDVQKGDRSHSSTAVGKSSILGGRMRSPNPKNKLRLHIASFLQDGYLNTSRSAEPKYMPGMLGGSNVTDLFGNSDNTYLYLISYKGGSYSRVYGTAINELKDCVRRMDAGEAAQPVMCRRLRQKQTYLHGTYRNHVLVPREIGLKTNLSEPSVLYEAVGGDSSLQAVENRLIRAKVLITRSQAEVTMLQTERILNAIYGTEEVNESSRVFKEFKENLRKKYDGALNANAAIQRLLERTADGSEVITLIREGFLDVNRGVLHLTRDHVNWISSGGRGEAFSMYDCIFSEDMYAFKEVSIESSMRVGSIPLNPVLVGKQKLPVETRAELGLWNISETQKEWAESLTDSLIQCRNDLGRPLIYNETTHLFNNNREWVSDDALIIGHAREFVKEKPRQTLALVSSDRRLANTLTKITGAYVILIRPDSVILRYPEKVWSTKSDIPVEQIINEIKRFKISEDVPPVSMVYMDTGSISAVASKMAEGRDNYGNRTGSIYSKKYLDSGVNKLGKRYVVTNRRLLKQRGSIKARLIAPNEMSTNAYLQINSEDPEAERLLWRKTPYQSLKRRLAKR